jgi:uncharacterized protein YkuJ
MYAKPTIIILGLLTVLVARGAFGMYQKSDEAIAKRDKALGELQILEVRQKELDEDISRLSSLRGQEEEIRDRFMVAREGEKVIIVASPEKKTTHTVTVSEEEQPVSFVDKMKSAVGVSGN